MKAPDVKQISLPLSQLIALRRNPQYLTEKQSAALVKSIQRDGFLAPIVVRKKGTGYEILSGNHRVISSREAGLVEIPCVLIDPCDDKRAARIAVNMNTVHGDPTAELLAPFLADMDRSTLAGVFMDQALIDSLVEFDTTLAQRLAELQIPDALDNPSAANSIPNCRCPKCGSRHVRARAGSKSSRSRRATTSASSPSSIPADTQLS